MRRFLLLLVILAIGGAGAWYALRGGGPDASTRVTALLPADTLAFVHVPDFPRALTEWRQTDIYKLWREPGVQEFVQKPLANMPNTGTSERLEQLEALGARSGFVAVRGSQRRNEAKVFGGFRFKGGRDNAEKTIGTWRARLREKTPAATQETVQHQRHRIEVLRAGSIAFATAYIDDWFFAANDLEELRALLDRYDRKAANAALLADEANFTRAFAHLPETYAIAGYARVDEIVTRLAANQPEDGSTRRFNALRQVRNVAAATRFENGKIRDVLFVTMPRAEQAPELTRSSLALASADTFFYLAGFLTLPKDAAPDATNAPPPAGIAGRLQQLFDGVSASGVAAEEWNSAFGAEFGVIGEWPAAARFPGLLATLPVKDEAKANEIVTRLTGATGEGTGWTTGARDGATFYSQLPANPLLPLAPTIGIGGGRAVAGLELRVVEAAVNRGNETSLQLADADLFKAAEGLLPKASHSFAYVDTAMLYTRLDAALRPMLIMGAAFMPAIAQAVDLSKLPDTAVITQHLSPIVLSQSYQEDGYLAESIGPLSAFQAMLGVAGASGAGAMFYQNTMRGGMSGSFPLPSAPLSIPALAPSPSPEESP